MTTDAQSTGRQAEGGRVPRRLRLTRASRLRVAAVGSALCLAAGMGISMATQASAAPTPAPPTGGSPGHGGVLPVCISFGGILRLALPLGTCNGPIVYLLTAGGHRPHPPVPPSGISTYVRTDQVSTATADANSGFYDLTANPTCDSGDVATGGGFSVTAASGGLSPAAELASGGHYATVLNAPTTGTSVSGDGDQPDGWTAGIQFGGTNVTGLTRSSLVITAYVVCTQGSSNMGGGPGGGGFGGGPGGGGPGGFSSPAHAAARH